MRRPTRSLAAVLLAVVLILTAVPAGWAKEPATPDVGLNQAVEMALKHSASVQRAEKEIDRTEELRNYSAERLGFMPVGSDGTPAVDAAWSGLLAADLTWNMSKKSLTAEQDKVALDTCRKYWAVQTAREKLAAAEAAVRQAELDFRKAQVSHQVGLIGGATLEGARAALDGANAALAATRNDLETAYAALNQTVGLWPEDRPVLTDTPVYVPLDVADLNHEVARVLESSPKVWLAGRQAELKEKLQDVLFYTDVMTGNFNYKPYQARKIEVEQAELDAMSAKEAYELLTRSLYYNVKSLEESIPAAEQAVRLAEENLKVARAKFAVGMATQAAVAAAEASLAKAESDLLSAKANHAYLKLAFEKPWAYLSLMGQSGGADSSSTDASGDDSGYGG
ncbi:MAG: TolC family protein [Bacillota bacterium]|nr:TolC family protein [Bacillota bacterium]